MNALGDGLFTHRRLSSRGNSTPDVSTWRIISSTIARSVDNFFRPSLASLVLGKHHTKDGSLRNIHGGELLVTIRVDYKIIKLKVICRFAEALNTVNRSSDVDFATFTALTAAGSALPTTFN